MRLALVIATPVAVFLAHLIWNVTVPFRSTSGVLYMVPPIEKRIWAHIAGDGLWFGASYALAVCFIVIALGRFRDRRREALAGAAGGTVLAGGIYAFGCFMLGCCGSPMAVVWLSLMGGRYANLGGVLLFMVTLLSTSAGLWILSRNDKRKISC